MTPAKLFQRALKVSSTSSGFPSTIPTITEPVTDGVWSILNGEETLELLFFGAGADNNAFDARVVGWSSTGDGKLWIPVSIVEVTATRSAVVGIASQLVINTDRFADTITVNKGVGTAFTVTSDAEPALLVCDISAFQKFQLIFNLTAGTDMNALYRLY